MIKNAKQSGPKGMRKARLTKQRDVRIHAELWHSANCLLRAGQQHPRGSAHQFRASLVFRAFALEAFLNWMGQHLIAHWNYLERLKPIEKLTLVAGLTHVSIDYGARPWQIVRELFAFRNYLAHGKQENLAHEKSEERSDFLDEKLGEQLETNWEQFGTEANAIRALRDVEIIARTLYEAADMRHKSAGPYAPFAFGFQAHEAQLEQPQD